MMEVPEEKASGGAPEWMVTFADLMSLLLTFFVLLLSFSNMEIVKFRTMAGSVRNALGLKSEFDLSDVPRGSQLLPYEDPREGKGEGATARANVVREQLREMLRGAGLPSKASIRGMPGTVILQLEGDLLFDSGKAELNPASFGVLKDLSALIGRVGHPVDVLGHTDSLPIATTVYPSNWELSGARAGRAVRYLVENGVPPEWLRATGFADTHPVASNETATGRDLNRRVEFVFRIPPADADEKEATEPLTVEQQKSEDEDEDE